MSKDCYIFIDLDDNVPEEQRTFSHLCVDCHNKYHPDSGWFWEGSKNGYGPWIYRCAKCQILIHSDDD